MSARQSGETAGKAIGMVLVTIAGVGLVIVTYGWALLPIIVIAALSMGRDSDIPPSNAP